MNDWTLDTRNQTGIPKVDERIAEALELLKAKERGEVMQAKAGEWCCVYDIAVVILHCGFYAAVRRVQRACKSGKIPAKKVGRQWRIWGPMAERWVRENEG